MEVGSEGIAWVVFAWSETQLPVKGTDSGHILANTVCGREVVGEVGDVQAYCEGIWFDEVEMIMIAELDESLCLLVLFLDVPGKTVWEASC